MTKDTNAIVITTGRVHLQIDPAAQSGADLHWDPTRYEVTIIESGPNKNGWIMPLEVLTTAIPKFAAAPCQIDHAGWFEMPSLSRLAGTIETPYIQDNSLRGYLRLQDTPAGDLLGRLFDAWLTDKAAGLEVVDVGLSAVLWASFDYIEGDRICNEIQLVESVDAVLHPAAGGKVERVLNSLAPNKVVTVLCQDSQAIVGAGSSSPSQGATPPASQRSTTMPEERVEYQVGGNETAAAVTPAPAAPAVPTPADAEISLTDALASIRDVARTVLALQQDVDRLTGFIATQEANRTIIGHGQAPRDPEIRNMRDSMDRITLAFDAMMSGIRPPADVQPLSGIRELYTLLSGDYEMTGRFNADRVYLSNVNSSTMAALVANALNKLVVNQFLTYPHWWTPIVIEMDFATLQDARWITLGGIGELPTVAEGAAYTELTWDDQTETAAFVKKGGYLGLTIEAIDKDDTRRLRMAPMALAQAAWLTLATSVSEIFTSNSGVGPTLADTGALFNATAVSTTGGHANLGTTALSHAEWNTVRQLQRDKAELNSSTALGALTAPKFLLVPNELELTALQIMATEHTPGAANFANNPFAEGDARMARLQSARDRVIVMDLWTDANNWAAVADPNLYPSLAIGYRYGRTPEIFSVASPTAGLMFSNDVMPVKVRFFYAAGVTDYRGLYKENVA